jgi:transposase
MHFAGIDVSAKKLDLSIRRQEKAGKVRAFSNTPGDHQAIIKVLKKAKVSRVCLEATGVYHIDLAVALHEAGPFEVMVVNPKAAKRFAEATMTRTKTDAVDAALLAEYAERMPFTPWQRPSNALLAIRACARRLVALTKQRTQAKNQLHAWQATEATPAFIIEDVRLSIAQLDAQIERLRHHSLALIGAEASLSKTLALLLSVKGIGEASAIQLMGELLVLPPDMSARQWVAMAGLDPRHHQSGSSVNKQSRISKVGNRYLRMALYMPALSAARHDRHVRGYYHHLIENRGLKKIQAVCAVMRKLLHALHGMLRNQAPFDGTRFCTLPLPTS